MPQSQTNNPSAVNTTALSSLLATAATAPVDHEMAFLKFIPAPLPLGGNVWDFEPTDHGRSRFMLEHFREFLRYVPECKHFRIWVSGWHEDPGDQRLTSYVLVLADWQRRLASQMAAADRAAFASKYPVNPPPGELAAMENTIKARNSAAMSLGNARTISAMIALTKSHGELTVPISRWDANPMTVGTANGTLCLKTGDFHAGRPEDYVTKRLSVCYDPAAACPHWEAFIAKVLPDPEVSSYVQRLVGYSLTGDMSDQSFYFLHGVGQNGKSMFLDVIARILGDYAGNARREMIEDVKFAAYKTDLAQLPGIRLLIGLETSADGKLRDDVIKSLTAGDPMKGEAKYMMPFEFRPCCKLWLAGNHKPVIEGTDFGIWRRVKLIPFTTVISAEDRIPQTVLLSRLLAEGPGILNWALEGLRQWSIDRIPATVKDAVSEYRSGEDDIGDFLDETTEPCVNAKTHKVDLYQAYSGWATSVGIRNPWTMKRFSRRLKERGFKLDSSNKKWLDIKVTNNVNVTL
jgi:putative DNA primase/helicase